MGVGSWCEWVGGKISFVHMYVRAYLGTVKLLSAGKSVNVQFNSDLKFSVIEVTQYILWV